MAVLVFSRSQNRKIGFIWGCFCLLVVLWGLAEYNISLSISESSSFLWWQLGYISTIISPVVYTIFVVAFLQINKKYLILSSSILASIFLFANIFMKDLFLGDLKYVFNQFYWHDWIKQKSPIFLIFYIVFYWFLLLYVFSLLLVNYKKSDSLKRNQLKYFIIGSMVGWLGPHGFFLLDFGFNIYPFTTVLIAIYPIIMGYAIVRHQLMDIEVIIRRALVFAGLFSFAYGVFAGIAYLTQDVFQSFFGGNRWLGMIPSVFIVILALDPLKRALVSLTDRFLFQKKYNYRDLLKTFSNEVLTVLDLDILVNMTVNSLAKIIRLETCALFLFNKEKEKYELRAFEGLHNLDVNFNLDQDYPIINYFQMTHTYLLNNKNLDNLRDGNAIKQELKKIESELMLPVFLHDELLAIISLGRKKSGVEYDQDDLDILVPLAQTLAVAISNATLFVELSRTQAEAAQREKMAVIGTLAAGINHEICNPLGIARGQSETFLLNYKDGIYKEKTQPELLAETMRILELSIKEIDRATAITKKLSTFAKPSRAGEMERVYLDKELDEVLALLSYELKLDKIEFKKVIPDRLSPIIADKKQIQEIVFNLIRNAAQAIMMKPNQSSGKITFFAQQSDSAIHIDIEDNGCGIPEDKIKQIFNPFYTSKEPGKGTGLGLFIVRQIVERNKGKINFKSKEGVGTTFNLEFPIAEREEARI